MSQFKELKTDTTLPHNPGLQNESSFRWSVAVVLMVVLCASYGYFLSPRGWNNGTRLMMTYAMGDRGTFSIDGLQEVTHDRAFIDGHYYCDKPPGQSLLGLPAYLLVKWISGISHPMDAPVMLRWWPDWFVTMLGSGIPTVLTSLWLYQCCLLLGCTQRASAITALSYGLASPAYPYAVLFHGHQAAAWLGFGAWMVLFRARQDGAWSSRRLFWAGLMSGGTVLTEYTQLFLSVGLALWVVYEVRSLSRIAWFAIPAAGCAVGLMLYHWAVFGGPFEFGYYHLTEPAFQEIYSDSQTFGLQTPKLDVAWKILFSWHGLIPYAPAIVLVPWGLMNLWRNGQRSVVAFIALAFGSLWLINASHPTWTGGWTTGPRYVQAGVPFLYLAVAMSQKQAGVWGKGILYGGTVLGFVICLGSVSWEWGGHLPDLGYAGGENPISQVIYPQLRKGIMLNWSLGNWMIYGEWSHPQRGNYEAYLLLLGFVGVMVSLLFRLTSSPQLAFPSGWEMASVFTGVREQLPEFSVHEVVGTETHRDQNIGTGVQEATIPEASSKAL